jgi:putative heme-binding domain-containing protein
MLVYLESPLAVPRGVQAMQNAVTQETVLGYAMALRTATTGWTPSVREDYFQALNQAESKAGRGDFVGGGHLQIYIQGMRNDAREKLTADDAAALVEVLDAKLPSSAPTGSPTPRPFINRWTVESLTSKLQQIKSGRSFENGKAMYTIASCAACHRFQNRGGIFGPDLSAVGKRYSRQVLLREMLEPSVQVSDQFQMHSVTTLSGKVVQGRILNRDDLFITIATDPRNPTSVTRIPADDVDEVLPSKTSMMPQGLLDTLTEDEVLDLMAYLESGGNPKAPQFAPSP